MDRQATEIIKHESFTTLSVVSLDNLAIGKINIIFISTESLSVHILYSISDKLDYGYLALTQLWSFSNAKI